MANAVADAKVEWCRGQMPGEFTMEQYNAAPKWVKDYINGNMDQYKKGDCKIMVEAAGTTS